MKLKTIAAVAAVLGGAVSYGADVGKYMLPDADIVSVTVSDINKKGAYTKALEAAVGECGGLEGMLKGIAGADKDAAKIVDMVTEYIVLVTNGVTRTESAFSAKATPGANGEPDVSVAFALAGFKNGKKLVEKLAADFPDAVKLANGALVPAVDAQIKAKMWAEGDVLRVVVGKAPEQPAAKSPLAGDAVFGKLAKKLRGEPYTGLRIKDPVGIAKRFMPAEKFAELAKDEQMTELLKLRNVGWDCSESKTEPECNMTLGLQFDTPETASAAAEKLIGFKQMGLMMLQKVESTDKDSAESLANAKRLLSSVKVESKGPNAFVKVSVSAKDQIEALKQLPSAVAK